MSAGDPPTLVDRCRAASTELLDARADLDVAERRIDARAPAGAGMRAQELGFSERLEMIESERADRSRRPRQAPAPGRGFSVARRATSREQ
jgi:hypothetical protein